MDIDPAHAQLVLSSCSACEQSPQEEEAPCPMSPMGLAIQACEVCGDHDEHEHELDPHHLRDDHLKEFQVKCCHSGKTKTRITWQVLATDIE